MVLALDIEGSWPRPSSSFWVSGPILLPCLLPSQWVHPVVSVDVLANSRNLDSKDISFDFLSLCLRRGSLREVYNTIVKTMGFEG